MLRDIINAESYYEAAREHIKAAEFLYKTQRYALCIYVSGLSAECIFRAFKAKDTNEFDERHDLKKLYESSKFAELTVPVQVEGALSVLSERWKNAHRFRSAKAMARYFKKAKLDRGIKGDFLKENSRRVYRAALDIVNAGVAQWKD